MHVFYSPTSDTSVVGYFSALQLIFDENFDR